VKCPLYARAIDIFWAAPASAAKLLFLPFFLIFLNLVLEPLKTLFLVTGSF